jgi:phenylacetate-CoA ligase
MLKLKGTLVYPQQIEEILMQEPGIVNYALEAYNDDNDCDAIKIMVGLHKYSDNVMERITTNLKARIRITPKIIMLHPQEILKIWYRNGSRKPQKFIDIRPDSLTDR